MTETRKAWQSARHQAPSVSLPRPSNENSDHADDIPWETVRPSDPMPLMFAVSWSTGRTISYAYSDLRVVDCPSPSEIVLSLYSMEKTRLSMVGRNLTQLARLLSLGQILAISQTNESDWFDLAEAQPAIHVIKCDILTGP